MKLGFLAILFVFLLSSCGVKDSFTITWKNYDGTILEIDENVKAGTPPTYHGMEPSKPKDDEYTYIFSGWSPNIEAVTKDATYTAKYDQLSNDYIITWRDYDGSTLKVERYPYGITPSYGADPVRYHERTDRHWHFKGWDKIPYPVTSNETYYAQYDECAKITWATEDKIMLIEEHAIIDSVLTYKGDIPTKEDKDGYRFFFTEKWLDSKGNEPSIAVSDNTYFAQFSSYPIIYRINYDLNGGKWTEGYFPRSNYIVTDEPFDLGTPTLEGKVFAYWEDQYGNHLNRIKQGTTGDLFLKACWANLQYSVLCKYDILTATMLLNDGTDGVYQTQCVSDEQKLVFPGIPTRSGHAFKGWYKEEECLNIFDFTQNISSNVNVYAGWQDIGNNVFIDLIARPSPRIRLNTEKRNYFTVFKTDIDGYYRFDFEYIVDGEKNISLYKDDGTRISYQIISGQGLSDFTIRDAQLGGLYYLVCQFGANVYPYDRNGYPSGGGMGVVPQNILYTVNFKESYRIPPHPQMDGKNFIGWFDSEVGGTQFTDASGNSIKPWDILENKNLYPHFS